MITPAELEAMLFLLDDTDETVVGAVESRLLSEGTAIIPLLESYWAKNEDPVRAFRIETVLKMIQEAALVNDFKEWKEKGSHDLLQACLLICRIQYPGLQQEVVHRYLDKVRLDAWMAMYSAGNPLDKVRILNHVLFERQGLHGNSSNYHAPDNSFLHRLIETRMANPITLSCLYMIIAQRLGMPVFGVNLPQHFVLAYLDELDNDTAVPYDSSPFLKQDDYGKVLFYINPFSNGQVFVKSNIDEFLQAIQVQPRKEFYQPCNNVQIVKRMLRNLHFSYSEIRNSAKTAEVERLMKLMGIEDESFSGPE